MSGAKHKRKGDRVERELVKAHEDIGVPAERVPMSGAVGGSYSDDIVLKLSDGDLRGEVKARKGGAGFVTLERWLGEAGVLFLKRDRQEPIVVLPWRTWTRMLKR